jgi:hypothetical protein
MQTIEMMVYIVITILIGTMFFLAVKNWDYLKDLQKIKEGVQPKIELGYKKADNITFVKEAVLLWNSCKFGELERSTSLMLDGKGAFTIGNFFSIVKKLNECDTLQNSALECGERDDVEMNDLILPRVVKLRCADKKLYIE